MIERCGDRQRKCDGLEKWPFRFFIDSLPLCFSSPPFSSPPAFRDTCGRSTCLLHVSLFPSPFSVSSSTLGSWPLEHPRMSVRSRRRYQQVSGMSWTVDFSPRSSALFGREPGISWWSCLRPAPPHSSIPRGWTLCPAFAVWPRRLQSFSFSKPIKLSGLQNEDWSE